MIKNMETQSNPLLSKHKQTNYKKKKVKPTSYAADFFACFPPLHLHAHAQETSTNTQHPLYTHVRMCTTLLDSNLEFKLTTALSLSPRYM